MNALVTQEQEYRPHGALLQICLAAFQEIYVENSKQPPSCFPGKYGYVVVFTKMRNLIISIIY
ncbi:hypothetical protein CS542_08030 [Pedobacter sp. IW39]|nr:hypothetical protein CS542_08030 [Pedobacter sp. IW39]